MKQLDVLFINPNSAKETYQDLSNEYSAIETPTWSLLLAEACRRKGFSVQILDCDAERLTKTGAVERIKYENPRLACFVVYGQNPNSGTTNMSGAAKVASDLKKESDIATCFVGSHTSALPLEVISYDFVDFVLLNEGVYALQNLLRTDLKTESQLTKVRGIGFSLDGQYILNAPEHVVPQDKMDTDLPGYAWDLLPYEKRPLDLYRAHFWHSNFNHGLRSPFAAIYTSLGCRFKCSFCMINILNRKSNEDGMSAADSPMMRFWSPDFIVKEFDKLAKLGVETLRISDEMFFLDKRYFEPLVNTLAERDYGFNMWAYSRVDTVREKYLEIFKKAGINWLALGIEAANQKIRQEVSKGTFKEVNIRKIVKEIRDADINVISNYIFGFPDDNMESMNHTLDLALELNTEMANMYPCQALPGSPLYYEASTHGWELPNSYEGFSFLSYETQPLPTRHLSAAEVLQFRDDAWNRYFRQPAYLDLVERRFGLQQRHNVENMSTIKLKRKLLGD